MADPRPTWRNDFRLIWEEPRHRPIHGPVIGSDTNDPPDSPLLGGIARTGLTQELIDDAEVIGGDPPYRKRSSSQWCDTTSRHGEESQMTIDDALNVKKGSHFCCQAA